MAADDPDAHKDKTDLRMAEFNHDKIADHAIDTLISDLKGNIFILNKHTE